MKNQVKTTTKPPKTTTKPTISAPVSTVAEAAVPSRPNVKKRVWTFVLYPESAPADWVDRLRETGLPVAISPLHDRDVNPTGEPKKPHHHVILVYSGPTTYNAVKTFTASLNQPIPQPLESAKGMYRYFTHKDNPEKAQYDEADIRILNGFSVYDLCDLTRNEINEIKIRVTKMIKDLELHEYSALVDFLVDNEMQTEYDVVSSNTIFFNTYLTSRRHVALSSLVTHDVTF